LQNILGLTGTCLIDLGRTRSGPSDSDPTSQSGSAALTEITIPAMISTRVGPGSELGRWRTRLGHRDRTPRTGEGRSTARGGRRRRQAIAVAWRRKIEGTEEAWRRSPCGGASVTRGRRGEATEKWVDDGPSSCGAPMAAAVSGLGFVREGGCGSERV